MFRRIDAARTQARSEQLEGEPFRRRVEEIAPLAPPGEGNDSSAFPQAEVAVNIRLPMGWALIRAVIDASSPSGKGLR